MPSGKSITQTLPRSVGLNRSWMLAGRTPLPNQEPEKETMMTEAFTPALQFWPTSILAVEYVPETESADIHSRVHVSFAFTKEEADRDALAKFKQDHPNAEVKKLVSTTLDLELR